MFTENQVRQFYVATGTAADVIAPVEVDSSHAATDLSAKSDGACQLVLGPNKDEFYLQYKGPKDGTQRSDIIKICNVMDVRLTGTKDMVHKNKKAIITLDSTLFDSSTKKLKNAGDYVMNVEIKNYIALGYDSTKIKFAVVRGTTDTTESVFYKKMALNLAKNFAREGAPMVDIYLCKTDLTSATSTSAKFIKVTSKTAESSLSDTYLGICIEETAQPWRLGAAKVEYVDFEVHPSTITTSDGSEAVWGKVQFYGSSKYTDGTSSSVTIGAPNTQPNSKAVADMEYFFHKERGDVYGYAGFPYNIDTVYQVDAANQYGYSFIDIHYYFEGNSHNVGHSEKTLTIVVPGAASDPEANAQKLVGAEATTGQNATAATGLYAWLEGTGVNIKVSPNWDA